LKVRGRNPLVRRRYGKNYKPKNIRLSRKATLRCEKYFCVKRFTHRAAKRALLLSRYLDSD
jgi:hypothetical protein